MAEETLTKDTKPENGTKDEDFDEEDEDYPTWIRSVRSKTGLETAIEIDWPSSEPGSKISLSTCLEPDDIAPMFNGTQWAGTRVWRSSIVATQYLLQVYGDNQQTMLELGAGLGVPGMMMHALRGWQVVLTDKDPLPKQLAANCKANFGDEYGKSIEACGLDWSRQGVKSFCALNNPSFIQSNFDVVLSCDCVYEPLYGLSWKLLVETMDELLRINPACVMITCLERRTADGVDRFLEALQQSDHVSNVDRLDFECQYPEVQIYRIYGCI